MSPEDRLIADVVELLKPILDGRLKVDNEPMTQAALALTVKEMVDEMRSNDADRWINEKLRIETSDNELWLWVRVGRLTPRVHNGKTP